ncbi:hypothetical protein H8B15_07195 [Hymenobacter sp. BT507]|uniref:Uncharacterized protein n=1 Tax=Hymenobacter citatus TaxID=2763506 RepID=A0ABR7MI20_9BACT|nr:hypothetical protein [Hymenobacter citatus]MBC6610702.1 hypothetical protein [Hymenobacter citatus]
MGIRPRKISVNFWRINTDSNNEHSEKILNDAIATVDCSKFKSFLKGESYSLDAYAVEDRGDYIQGALVHNQMANLPPTYATDSKQFGLLPLTPGQGLSKTSCFVFEKRRRILLLESPGEGSTTARDWCLYLRTMLLEQRNGRFPHIHPAVIENLDARAVFKRLTRITQLRVHIARLRDVSMFRDEATRQAITSSFKVATESGSDEIICTFKVPSRPPKKRQTDLGINPSLQRSFVDKFVSAMDELDPRELSLLQVVGQEEDLERLTQLNLLANRVTDSISAVPFTDSTLPSSVAVRHRCQLILELFEKHAAVIQSVGGE